MATAARPMASISPPPPRVSSPIARVPSWMISATERVISTPVSASIRSCRSDSRARPAALDERAFPDLKDYVEGKCAAEPLFNVSRNPV